MKKLHLITVLLVLITTKLSAQEKNIEIKKIENNQFKIVAKEEMNINLKFNLDPETNYSVLIFDKRMNKVSSRKKHKKGEFKITFSIEEGEQYTVKFIGINPIKLIPTTFAEN